MTDTEKRAHDLAVVFAQNLYPDISKQLDESTLEFLLERFASAYESAYDYLKGYLEQNRS